MLFFDNEKWGAGVGVGVGLGVEVGVEVGVGVWGWFAALLCCTWLCCGLQVGVAIGLIQGCCIAVHLHPQNLLFLHPPSPGHDEPHHHPLPPSPQPPTAAHSWNCREVAPMGVVCVHTPRWGGFGFGWCDAALSLSLIPPPLPQPTTDPPSPDDQPTNPPDNTPFETTTNPSNPTQTLTRHTGGWPMRSGARGLQNLLQRGLWVLAASVPGRAVSRGRVGKASGGDSDQARG